MRVGRSNDEGNAKGDRQLDALQRVSTLFATEPQAAIAKKIALLTRGGQLSESLFIFCRRVVSRETPRSWRSATLIMAAPPPAMTLTERRGGLGLPQAGIVHAA